MTNLNRCSWVNGDDALMARYHDEEWGMPQRDGLGAKIYCDMAKKGEDFATFCWSFTAGKVLRGDGRSLPVSTLGSEAISKELKRRGFKFAGPVIVYAWMQAVGMVDDHAADCFRRRGPRPCFTPRATPQCGHEPAPTEDDRTQHPVGPRL